MQETPELPPFVTGVDDETKLCGHAVRSSMNDDFRRDLRVAQTVEGLLNNGSPTMAVKETPAGRSVCYAAMGGMKYKDIATQFGMSTVTVSNLLRQPWAKTFMTEEFRRLAKEDGVIAFLREEAMSSARQLVEIRDNPATSPKTRAEICDSILDRVFGKATQRVEAEQKTTIVEATDEASKIDAELKALREQVYGRGDARN